MRTRGEGTLVVLSSVAGERVRASNAIYGAAKAGLDALVQGLSDSLAGSGVRVLVVRPGFVTTRMTAGLDPAPMSATADEVAAATVAALDGRAHTVWVPGKLRYVFADPAPPSPLAVSPAADVRQRALLIDLGLAVVVAIVILIVSPGLAVTAIVALDPARRLRGAGRPARPAPAPGSRPRPGAGPRRAGG